MRKKIEICEIFGFWREISKYYPYTPRVYSYTYTPRVFSRQKSAPPGTTVFYNESTHPYAKEILKTRVWEANEDQR